jgi:hypothetical protein
MHPEEGLNEYGIFSGVKRKQHDLTRPCVVGNPVRRGHKDIDRSIRTRRHRESDRARYGVPSV